ncbi:MAG: hypothetical protein KKF44_08380 [Nanoarchaeota archaeon]|nr:hypothetical protein [Nanoarchaeota archaeon]
MRAVALNEHQPSGGDKEYYHWAVVKTKDGFSVRDFWDTELLTTAKYEASPEKIFKHFE